MTSVKLNLRTAFGMIGDSIGPAARNLEVQAHLHPWHPISTAPGNQNLEVEIISNGEPFAVPFPCRKLNSGEWINSDLGVRVQIHPTRWRTWSYQIPVDDHRFPVRPGDHDGLLHTHGPISRRSLEEND